MQINQIITYVLTFSLFFYQSVFGQERNDVILPQIPIYIINNTKNINFNIPNIFEIVKNKDDAFFTLIFEELSSHRGYKEELKILGVLLSSIVGYKIGSSENSYLPNDFFTKISSMGVFLNAAVFSLYTANKRKSNVSIRLITHAENKIFTSILSGESKEGKNLQFKNGYWFIFAIDGGIPIIGQLFSIYAISMYYEGLELFKSKNRSYPNFPIYIKEDWNFLPENIKQFIEVDSLLAEFEKEKNEEELILKNWSQNLFVQFEKPRGEFETTQQYEERLKKEELTKRSIEAEYQQKLALKKDEYVRKRTQLGRKIENMNAEIQFERSFSYSMSSYVADKQLFSFTIPSLNETKDLVVPIDDAQQFKATSENLVIKQMVKPSLDGRWIPVYDDVVLADASTGKIIPWEGEVPTYAVAPVTNPPSLSAAVDLSEPSGEGYLDAEELATLKVTLTNSGSGSAKTTRISVSQKSGPTLYYDVSATVNSIAPGKSHTERFQITVPENVKNGQVAYTVSFLEAQGFEPDPVNFTADVRAQREPILSLIDFGVSDQNGDGKVSKGESAEIIARIQNKGQGMAKNVRVNVNPEGNEIFMHPDSKDKFTLGNIPAGEARDVTFTVLTNNRVGDMANIELKLDEKRPRFSKTELVKLEIDKQQKQLATLSFKGTSSDVAIANLATLTVEIEKDIPKGKKKNPDALAVVFGIESYKNVSDVTFAKRDATYMKEYFEKALGIPAKRIYYKTNDDVGKAEFDKVFSKDGWLDKRVKEGKTDLYIYYAGHGAPDIKKNKAYLIPYDGDPNYASQTGYEMDELYEQLGNLSARSTTVFLDACFTGANRESEILLAGARPVFMEVDESATRDVTVFSASSGSEISSAWPEKKHGLFSYYLMKGMRGDADVNGDKKITVGELGNYVKENVSDMAGMLDREQTPGLQTLDNSKVLVQYE